MSLFTRTPSIVAPLAKNLRFSFPNKPDSIFLTFDDGPHPTITPWVLDQLESHNAKATFFLVGSNAEKHPSIVEEIKARGHTIGNHTMTHLNGWKTNSKTYVESVDACAPFAPSFLFRPPYGKLTRSQSKMIRAIGYEIIMWSVLPKDYDSAITRETCLSNATKTVRGGDIIVFHDSEKAWSHLEYTLPRALAFYANKSFEMKAILD